MFLQSEIRVAHPDLVLVPTRERLPDVRIHSPCRLDGPPTSPQFYRFSTAEVGRLEEALTNDRTVTDERCVVNGDDDRIYRLRVSDDALTLSDPAAERGIRIHEATNDGTAWQLRLGLPDRDALNDFQSFCGARDVRFTVQQLRRVDDAWAGTPALTERQRETLVTAVEAGYFDVPRTATQADLAEHLGVSGSAVSQRLRRAVRQLISTCLQRPVD